MVEIMMIAMEVWIHYMRLVREVVGQSTRTGF